MEDTDELQDTDMTDAKQADFDVGGEDSAQQWQGDNRPSSSASQPPQPSEWKAPRAAYISDDIGLVGFFTDLEQQTKPPEEVLQKLLPGNDGSIKVKAFASSSDRCGGIER